MTVERAIHALAGTLVLARGAMMAALGLSAVGLVACGSHPAHVEAPPPARRAVQVHHARPQADAGGEEVIGTVRARSSAAISATVVGKISALPVSLGKSVRAGDVLVRLSADEINAKLEQAEVLYARSKIDFDRAQRLLGEGAVPKVQYDAAEAELDLARGRRAEAAAMASHTVLRAPFAGVVTRKQANLGDTAMPGQTLLVLEDPNALRLEATVPEIAARELRRGQTVAIRLDGGREAKGVIAEISPAADPTSRTVLAKIDLPADPALHLGLLGRFRLPSRQSPSLLVPAAAVLRRGQLEEVFVVGDGRATLRLVRTGRQGDDGATEILSGLTEGEAVVTSGTAGLIDGQLVELL